MTTALVIPEAGPVYEIELNGEGRPNDKILSEVVGGLIQELPLPSRGPGWARTVAFINEEGKFHPDRFGPNPRATALMMPCAHIAADDYIAVADWMRTAFS